MPRPSKSSQINQFKQKLQTYLNENEQFYLLAAFILALLGIIWIFFISPQLTKLPTDFVYNSELLSSTNFYDIEKEEYEGEQFSITRNSYKSQPTNNDSLLVDHEFKVEALDGKPIYMVERSYGVDRMSREHQIGSGDKDRSGYLFAPKGLEKGQQFIYWHANYDQPATMSFVKEEMLYGLTAYRYETYYTNNRIDQTSQLSEVPGVGENLGVELEPHLEIWIEPVTGRLIKYQDETTAYFYNLKNGNRLFPRNIYSSNFTETSIQQQVEIAQREKSLYRVIEFFIPLAIFIVTTIFMSKGTKRYLYRKTKPTRVLYIISSTVNYTIVLFSTLSLLGWTVGNENLIRLGTSYNATTNPLTALIFLSLSLIIITRKKTSRDFKLLFSIVLITITIVNILNIVGAISLEIDKIFLFDQVDRLNSNMSLFTSISFLLLGIALLTKIYAVFEKFRISLITSTTVGLLSLLCLFGLTLELFNIRTLPFFAGTSTLTASLMLIINFTFLYSKETYTKPRLSAINRFLVYGFLSLSIFVTVTIAILIEDTYLAEADTQFKREVEILTTSIEDRIDIYTEILIGTKGLLAASDNVSREEWETYVDTLDLQSNYPGIQGIGYSIFLEPEEKRSHIKQIRKEGFPDYSIKPEGNREIYTSIIYLEPFDERNKQAFGFDMFQEQNRRNAMQQALDTGEPKASGKITLLQEIDNDVQSGFLLYIPYYQNGADISTVDQRREAIIGFTYSPFRVRDFIEGTIGAGGHPDMVMTINDDFNGTHKSEIYNDEQYKLWEQTTPRFRTSEIINVAGRPWNLVFESDPNYGKSNFSTLTPIFVIGIGSMISILITIISYMIITSKQKAVEYAKRATKDLQETLAKDEAVLLSIGDGLVVTDKEGKITLTNHMFSVLTGWSSKVARGKKLTKLIPMYNKNGQEVKESSRMLPQSLKKKKKMSSPLEGIQYQRKDGSTFPVSITVSPVLNDGKTAGAVAVFRDITQEQEVDRAKTEFVSLASHQLRTPLTSINWYAELLHDSVEDNALSEEQLSYSTEIAKASKRMVFLVDTLLNVSRLELGTFSVSPQPTNIKELVGSVIQELSVLIANKELDVKTVGLTSKKTKIDPELFKIVFHNLITNAIKYTPNKGAIRVKSKIEADKLTLIIKDTGYGIPEKAQAKIFEKLYRADNIRSKDTDGTGLGLYMVKLIVEKSNGKIWFESEENKGTTFFIEMPIKRTSKSRKSK